MLYKKLGVWLGLLLVVAWSAEAKWQENLKTAGQSKILTNIEKQVAETKNPVVIFDLDSTLYDNRPRSAAIWREYGKTHHIPKLKRVKKEDITSWVIEDYLVKAVGVDSAWVQKNIKDLKSFWAKRFFSNDYLHYDQALPGAAKYVQDLYRKGAIIVYASGRDVPNMQAGTLKTLKRDRFPLDEKKVHLVLKPESNASFSEKYKSESQYKKALQKADVLFKEKSIRTILKLGTPIASFDNEPANINLYFLKLHRKGRQGVAIWLDTDHSPYPEVLQKGIVTVTGFKK